MCVMLCSMPKLGKWEELSTAISYRDSLEQLQLMSRQAGGTIDGDEPPALAESAVPRVMKRSAWIQAYFQLQATQQRLAELAESKRLSAKDWHHPLQAISDACRRLVAFLRWG